MKQGSEQAQKTATLKIKGDIRLVLEGQVHSTVMEEVHPKEFQAALGSGTFSHIERIGEAIIIHGQPHISWVEGNTVCTKAHTSMKTCFLMGLESDQGMLPQRSFTSSLSLQTLYEGLAKEYPEGFAIVAEGLFGQLHSTYLQKPPIYGENINQYASKYWAEVPIEENTIVSLFGVVIPDQGQKKFPQKMLHRAFYQNPHEKKTTSSVMSHTHGAILNKERVNAAKDISGDPPISSIRHVLTQSVVKEGVFSLFPIGHIIAG